MAQLEHIWLDQVELLLAGVRAVCRSWRRAAREEPELWRRIDLRYLPTVDPPFTRRGALENVTRTALRLSAGQCETFAGEGFDDDLFLLLAEQAPSLKRLQLIGYSPISNGRFANALRKLPLLEELQLVSCHRAEYVLQLVAKLCRCLKHFTLARPICRCYHYGHYHNQNAFAIAKMHGLRSLVLVGDELSNQGLKAIIDNCPQLEYIEVCDCREIYMNADLTAKCAQIFMDYYEYFRPYEPCTCICFTPVTYWGADYYLDYDHTDYLDLFVYSYLGDDIDCADFDEYERILDVKSMRRYLS